jgi:ATP-dependent DNA helicase RecQ
VHSAKGLEFRHVVLLDGGWSTQEDNLSDERRLYYVGMTRAEQTLTLCEFADANPFSRCLTQEIQRREFLGTHLPELEIRFQQLSLKDIDIGFAGRQPPQAPIHDAIRNLREGDPLTLKEEAGHYQWLDGYGNVVGRAAKSFQLPIGFDQCEVAAVIVWSVRDSDEQFRKLHQCERWEVLVPRVRGSFAANLHPYN